MTPRNRALAALIVFFASIGAQARPPFCQAFSVVLVEESAVGRALLQEAYREAASARDRLDRAPVGIQQSAMDAQRAWRVERMAMSNLVSPAAEQTTISFARTALARPRRNGGAAIELPWLRLALSVAPGDTVAFVRALLGDLARRQIDALELTESSFVRWTDEAGRAFGFFVVHERQPTPARRGFLGQSAVLRALILNLGSGEAIVADFEALRHADGFDPSLAQGPALRRLRLDLAPSI